MRTLYHTWLNPFSRKVRVVLKEKGLDFALRVENEWERRDAFLALNPAGEVPVLDDDGAIVADSGAICEYLEECHPEPRLIGSDPASRAEVRRLVAWFDVKFHAEVTSHLISEKVMKRFLGLGSPDSSAIRAAQTNLGYHLEYIAYLADRRKWLGGERFSLADIAAAAHISVADYLGDVHWQVSEPAKDWYARVKSRPSFRPLLADFIPGAPPPRHYADLDF
jgi:glutathione S-transferase